MMVNNWRPPVVATQVPRGGKTGMAVSDADRKVASQLMEQARREAAAAKGTSTPMSMLRKAARPATEDTMPVFSARKREQQQETIAVVPSTISRPSSLP